MVYSGFRSVRCRYIHHFCVSFRNFGHPLVCLGQKLGCQGLFRVNRLVYLRCYHQTGSVKFDEPSSLRLLLRAIGPTSVRVSASESEFIIFTVQERFCTPFEPAEAGFYDRGPTTADCRPSFIRTISYFCESSNAHKFTTNTNISSFHDSYTIFESNPRTK